MGTVGVRIANVVTLTGWSIVTLAEGSLGNVGALVSPHNCGGFVHRFLIMVPCDGRKTLEGRSSRDSCQLFLLPNQVLQFAGWSVHLTKILPLIS